MEYVKQNERIRQIAKDLLERGEVSRVIGFTSNEEAGHPTPVFIKDAADVGKLIWTNECYVNLASYLLDAKGKSAIIAKTCDARSIVNLLVEHQLTRENIVIIGVECEQMQRDGKPASGCDVCPTLTPVKYDYLVSVDGGDTPSENTKTPSGEKVSDWLMNTDAKERHERFMKEINKCILCFSCRQACPGCYCKTCFIDRSMTPWGPQGPDTASKINFHLVRTMHLAGRCVDCGACERACPAGVKIRYLISGINEFVGEMYDFKAGMDENAAPAMDTYSFGDKEVGFLGGEGDGMR